MVAKKQKNILIFCTMMSLNASAEKVLYVVKKGEILSTILYKHHLRPIYGKNGTLKTVLKLNPKINSSHGNKIFPGDRIKLEVENPFIEAAPVEQVADKEIDSSVRLSADTPLFSPPAHFESYDNSRSVGDVDREQYTFFRLAPQISWMKVTSQSSTQNRVSQISALSKANPGVLAAFGLNVKEDLNVQVFSYLSKIGFYDDGHYSLARKSFFRQAYGVGGEYRLDPVNRLSLRFGFFDELYLTMSDATTINIESAGIPEVHWGYRRVLGQYKNITLDSGLFGKFIIPYNASTVDSKFGYGVGGDFLLMLKSKGLRFFYNYSDAKAQNKSTKTIELGWNIIFEEKIYE